MNLNKQTYLGKFQMLDVIREICKVIISVIDTLSRGIQKIINYISLRIYITSQNISLTRFTEVIMFLIAKAKLRKNT